MLVLLVVAALAPARAAEVGERGALRLRYGFALHDGQQRDVGPGLTYDGHTRNDFALTGWVWPLTWLGVGAEAQREAFDLNEGATRITGGSLLRAAVGPRARTFLGPVRLEVGVGYGFAQLPVFGDSAEPVLARVARHAALVSGRVQWALTRGLMLEARGELPVPVAVKTGSDVGAEAKGFSAGGALLVKVLERPRWRGAVVLDFQFARDTVTLADTTSSEQTLKRMGAALEVSWNDAPAVAPVVAPPPPVEAPAGTLSVRVVDAATGAAVPGARVALTVEGVERAARPVDAQGMVEEAGLPVGAVVVRVSADGYEAAEVNDTVESGLRATLEVRARKAAPTTGSLRVTVLHGQRGMPLPDVKVMVGSTLVRTDLAGRVRVKDLPPGPVVVSVVSQGFRSAEEAALIIAGQEAELSVSLAQERKGEPATLTGQVRSTRGGKPLAATLLIAQAKVRTRTDARGTFSVKVKGGTYRITISARGHLSQTKVVTVREGEQAIFNVDLFPRQRR